MYDVMKMGYFLTTEIALENINKVFDRETVFIVNELKIYIKSGDSFYDIVTMEEVV